jgi:Rho termination factor, N-terminal domain
MSFFQSLDDPLDTGLISAGFRVEFLYGSHFGFMGNMLPKDKLEREERKMDVNELRKMTMPKLRDLAKQETDLKGVGGMEKEELVKAITKAKGIAYDESTKDLNAIHAVKQDIRQLKKQKAETLASSPDPRKLRRVRRKIKLLKRLTRHLAHEAKTAATAKAAQPAAPASSGTPAAPQATG